MLTGEWYTPDAFNPGVNIPIFMVYEFLLMKLFGQSLTTVRYGGVFCVFYFPLYCNGASD